MSENTIKAIIISMLGLIVLGISHLTSNPWDGDCFLNYIIATWGFRFCLDD